MCRVLPGKQRQEEPEDARVPQGGLVREEVFQQRFRGWVEKEDMGSVGTARVMLDLLDQREDYDSYSGKDLSSCDWLKGLGMI